MILRCNVYVNNILPIDALTDGSIAILQPLVTQPDHWQPHANEPGTRLILQRGER